MRFTPALQFVCEALILLFVLWRGIRTRYFKRLFKRSAWFLPGVWLVGGFLWRAWPYRERFDGRLDALFSRGNVVLACLILLALGGFLVKAAIMRAGLRLPQWIRKSGETYSIGMDEFGRDTSLSEKDLTIHLQMTGPSGCGKTYGVIFPFLVQAIEKGRACVAVDGKGELALIDNLRRYFAAKDGHLADFRFFIPALPEFSHTYNPLATSGTAGELTDKVTTGLSLNAPGEAAFYSATQHTFLIALFNLFLATGKRFNFSDIYYFMFYPRARSYVYDLSKDRPATLQMLTLLGTLKKGYPELRGMGAKIEKLFVLDRQVSEIVNTYSPDIDIKETLAESKLSFFSFSTGIKSETSEALARMVLADIANAVGERHLSAKNPFALIILDEFGQYASERFDKFIASARSANVGVVLSHQTNAQLHTADLRDRLARIVRDNTATKVIFRQLEEADFWAKMFGTRQVESETEYTDKNTFWGKEKTGKGSQRLTDEFLIHPNTLRELPVGKAAFRTGNQPAKLITTSLVEIPQGEAPALLRPERKRGEGLFLERFALGDEGKQTAPEPPPAPKTPPKGIKISRSTDRLAPVPPPSEGPRFV